MYTVGLHFSMRFAHKIKTSTQTKNKKIRISLFLSLVSTFHFSLFKLSLVSSLKTLLQLPLSSPCLYLTLFPPCLYLYWLTDGVPAPYGNTMKLGFFFFGLVLLQFFFFFFPILCYNFFFFSSKFVWHKNFEGVPFFYFFFFFFFCGSNIKIAL